MKKEGSEAFNMDSADKRIIELSNSRKAK